MALRGEIPNVLRFSSVFAGGNYSVRFVSLDMETRDNKIFKAVDLQKPWIISYPRFITAAIYFQHALRLISPHEVVAAPHQFFAEVVVNLSKCLEILLADKTREGKTNDKIRASCRLVGYSDEQIESQIIPILLIRSSFDGAHALGAKVPVEQVAILKAFIDRAINNVQSILLTVAEYIKKNEGFLAPLTDDSAKDRSALVSKMENYLKYDKLPE